MGKTTTLRTIMGILRKRSGEITFAGQDMLSVPLHKSARAGLGFPANCTGFISRKKRRISYRASFQEKRKAFHIRK